MTPFVKLTCKILGLVFIIIGIAGFFTGREILGIEVDTMHNVVHIVTGLICMSASGSYRIARLCLILLGFVYGIVAVIGFVNHGIILGLFETNQTGNMVHVMIALICLFVGLQSKKRV